jgi:hypothetical protein
MVAHGRTDLESAGLPRSGGREVFGQDRQACGARRRPQALAAIQRATTRLPGSDTYPGVKSETAVDGVALAAHQSPFSATAVATPFFRKPTPSLNHFGAGAPFR